MKRSEINKIIEDSLKFFADYKFKLPKFGYYKLKDWQKNKDNISEIMDVLLGWDITDFGKGDFEKCGLILFSVRNGLLNSSKYPKLYAEKAMISLEGQVTPMHYHLHKMEDIINRGGGTLAMQVFMSDKDGNVTDEDVELSFDGTLKTVKSGDWVYLEPGEGVTLTPFVYHTFCAKNAPVMICEVSMVNDDVNDNFFLEETGRFPEIEEDVAPEYLLVNDYKLYIGE